MALSYLDGTTLVPIIISGTQLKIDTTHTIQFTASAIAKRDTNNVPLLMGIDSVAGGLFPLLADPVTGAVLADVI